jgi:hypothetical protein
MDEVSILREEIARLREKVDRLDEDRRRRSRKGRLALMLLSGAAVLAFGGTLAAQSGDCADSTVVPFCFNSNTPAKASEVNANFKAITDNLKTNRVSIFGDQSTLAITDDDGESIVEITENGESGQVELTDNASLSVQGSVTVQGSATVQGSTSSDHFVASAGPAGYEFPNNPWGGGGDGAWIRYIQDGTGEDTALQIGVANDADDEIEFHQAGAPRMRIENGNVVVLGRLDLSGATHVSSELVPGDGHWGDWGGTQYCPEDSYVCGIRVRIEGKQGGDDDDTALNGVRLTCCYFGA